MPAKSNTIPRTCKFCHKVFYLVPWKVRKGEDKFCSPACYYKSRVKKDNEIWKHISMNHGLVGCWEYTGNRNANGYGRITFRGHVTLAHRVAWILMNGEIPEGLGVLHKCDNPPCCNPFHLFLGTEADNVHDMDQKGRRVVGVPHGSSSPNAKLTETQVLEIRRLRSEEHLTLSEIGKRFGIGFSHVSTIVRRKAWRHI